MTKYSVLKVASESNQETIGVVTPFVFCNQEINRWQMYFAGNTSEKTDHQIYTAFSPLGKTCEDPPFFNAEKGDLNNDGQVNAQDLKILLSNWGTHPFKGDFNLDSLVNGLDFGNMLQFIQR